MVKCSDMNTNIFSSATTSFAAAALLTFGALFLLPQPAAGLSCLNPAEMIEQYATDESYTVALIEAGAVETEGDEHDQTVSTKTLYKGELGATDTVTFAYNETWNYLCAGNPAEDGTEALYVLNDTQVVQVFAVDSELGLELLAAIDTPEVQPTEVTVEAEKRSLLEQIVSLLRQLIARFTPNSGAVVSVPVVTVVEIGNPVVEEPPVTEPGSNDAIIGMSTDEAEAYAKAAGVNFRLGMIDGEALAVTMDYLVGRITAEVEDDVVVSYTVE